MRKIQILLGATLALATGAALAADRVRVGVIYPLTGPTAQPGKDALAAVKVAQDIVNNNHALDLPLAATEGLPNLGGAKIELVIADHRGRPEIGRGEAERLIASEKVVAIMGAYHSSVSAAASNVTERMQIPYLTGESSSPKLHTRGFKWFFRTGPHDGHYTRTMFDFIRDLEKEKGVKLATAAIIHEDTQFGVDSARVQVELAKEAGIKVIEKIAYRAKSPSLVSEVQRLKAADADILFPTSYTADALLLMRTMKELDYAPRIIIAQNAGFNDATFLKTAGADAEGVISRSPFSMDMAARIPLIAKLNELYKKHNDDRDIFRNVQKFWGVVLHRGLGREHRGIIEYEVWFAGGGGAPRRLGGGGFAFRRPLGSHATGSRPSAGARVAWRGRARLCGLKDVSA